MDRCFLRHASRSIFQEEKHQILTTFGWLETVGSHSTSLRISFLRSVLCVCQSGDYALV